VVFTIPEVRYWVMLVVEFEGDAGLEEESLDFMMHWKET